MSELSNYTVSLLDYGAGNVRSLRNAILSLGYTIKDITTAEEIAYADVIVFPGQGSFKQAMKSLRDKGWVEPLREYLLADRPFFGICLGMQLLFESSEESPGEVGLSVIPGKVTKFDTSGGLKVPQIGWNGVSRVKSGVSIEKVKDSDLVYFVHSYCVMPTEENLDWILSLTDYGDHRYVSMVQKGNVMAAQFHPEKSGSVGLQMIDSFLSVRGRISSTSNIRRVLSLADISTFPPTKLAKRVIACLDVRSNDAGDLVVTKGDQYDVREAPADSAGRGGVRNLGKPVELCKRYYEEGADEVVFLNITSFRQGVLEDLPMLQVLEASSQTVFVPMTVGGGIREYVDSNGKEWSALDVTARYFRAGADKVSIGSDAVFAAESYLQEGNRSGKSSIEQISNHYGAQAVVISIDPKRVYIHEPPQQYSLPSKEDVSKKTILKLTKDQGHGPNGEAYCWWQVTVKGGRETRDIDAIQLAKISEILGAGEIMLNCIDMDGQGKGYDIALLSAVRNAVTIPVIASSGAGSPEHFEIAFRHSNVDAALAAGIFHRNEVKLQDVKNHLISKGIYTRIM